MHTVRNQLLESATNGSFLETIQKLYQEHRHEVGKQIAILNNEGLLNAPNEFIKTNSDNNLYTAERVLTDALPSLNSSVKSVMECISHFSKLMNYTGISSSLNMSFSAFCEADVSRPKDALAIATESQCNWVDFIAPALISGAKISSDEYISAAIELAQSKEAEICTRAIIVLGLIDYARNESAIFEVAQLLETLVNVHQDDQVCGAIIRTAFNIFKKNPDTKDQIIRVLSIGLSDPGEYTLHEAARLWMLEEDELPEFLVTIFFTAFESVNPKNNNTLQCLGYGLESMLKIDNGKRALQFIEVLLLKHEKEFPLECFDSFACELVKNKNGVLSWMLTKWLMSDHIILRHSAMRIIDNHIDNNTILSADLTQTNLHDSGFALMLSKRACGWLFFRPVPAISFILSLVEILTEEETKEVLEFVFNPILISYSASGSEYLKSLPDDASEKLSAIVRELLHKLDEYHAGLRSAMSSKELKPSTSQREAYYRKLSRDMNASYKEAQKGSVLTELFSNTAVLLYGSSMIHYMQNETEGDPTRQEMKLQSFSTSIEFPSLEHLNPHGLELTLLNFKI